MPEIELYPFQREDADKLLKESYGLNASEMGTGKTYTVATVAEERSGGLPKLWIGPLTTLESSARKIRQLYPDMPVVIVDPKNRDKSYDIYKKTKRGFYMVHWDVLRLMNGLQDVNWAEVVADEVHRAQNRKAQMTLALKRISTFHRQGASGTPVTGATDKYWSILNWLDKKEWSSYWRFYKNYCEFEIQYPQGYHVYLGPKNELELLSRLDPYYVRHLKKEQCCSHHPQGVMPWLPDKLYDTRYVDLTPVQRRAYDEMKKEMIAWVGAHEHEPIVAPVVVAQLTRLQQFACAYAALEGDSVRLSEPSSKIDTLMDIIDDNPTKQLVVFSQFTQMLKLIAARLDKKGITYAMYTGRNRNSREDEKESFVQGNRQIFLGNISAGGVGVDELQLASDTVIFTDRLWSPALNNQAEDRLWRDGQKFPVQVIDIMAHDTIDRGRAQRLEQKWEWIRKVLGDK